MGRYDRYTKPFKDAFTGAFADFDKEGPAIEVSPFAPGEATTGAGILRAITAMAGARRARANWEAAQREQSASRYKDVLETQLLEQRVAGTDPASRAALQNADSLRAYREGMLGIRRNPPAKPPKPASAADRAANASLYKLALEQFDQLGERYADEALRTDRMGPGGKKIRSIASIGNELARQINTVSAQDQLKIASMLGVQPEMDKVDEVKDGIIIGAKMRPMKNESGRYVFDANKVSKALESWLANRRSGLLSQWKAENAQHRSAYEQALLQTTFGDVEVPGDPLEDAALELFGD